jgi:Kef-type K+ transport system membrane component KefB
MSKIKFIIITMLALISVNLFIGGAYIGTSTAAFCLMCLGLYYRHTQPLHQKLMASAMGLDIAVVLTLEVMRGAIETTLTESMTASQYIHISTSLIAVLIYIAQIIFGLKLKKQPTPALRKMHRNFGITCFSFRLIGFLFMYSMLSRA